MKLRRATLFLAIVAWALPFTGELSAAPKRKGGRSASRKSAHTQQTGVDPAIVRESQNVLTELGFYFGVVDGELSEETQGALRRFQTYKKLPSSGQIDDATLAALRRANEEAASTPRQSSLSASLRPKKPQPPPSPPPTTQERSAPTPPNRVEQMANPLAPPSSMSTPSAPSTPSAVRPTRRAEPVRQPEVYPLLQGTPYAAMHPSAQAGLIQKLQAALARGGYYHGAINGVPTAATEEALFRFQSAHGLPLSGRLDPSTLEALQFAHSRRGSRSLLRAETRRGAPPPPSANQPQTLGPAGKMLFRRGAPPQ